MCCIGIEAGVQQRGVSPGRQHIFNDQNICLGKFYGNDVNKLRVWLMTAMHKLASFLPHFTIATVRMSAYPLSQYDLLHHTAAAAVTEFELAPAVTTPTVATIVSAGASSNSTTSIHATHITHKASVYT